MEMFEACEAFASLSQETRLTVFLMLVEFGRDGTSPGKLAGELKIPDNTLSFHLSRRSKAGLVTAKKNGRSITYFANTDLTSNLAGYLLKNCCSREKKPKSKSKVTDCC
jgi:DNA-binding transcriptional ArsR family regulator